MKPHFQIKRVYDPPSEKDGLRFLVDRLWPRGIKKENIKINGWLKKLAPSNELRRRFGHDPARFSEFQKAYLDELAANPSAQPLRNTACQQTVTLLYAAHDRKHNNAVVLKKFLEGKSCRPAARSKANAS